jgi:hypothetical protein
MIYIVLLLACTFFIQTILSDSTKGLQPIFKDISTELSTGSVDEPITKSRGNKPGYYRQKKPVRDTGLKDERDLQYYPCGFSPLLTEKPLKENSAVFRPVLLTYCFKYIFV